MTKLARCLAPCSLTSSLTFLHPGYCKEHRASRFPGHRATPHCSAWTCAWGRCPSASSAFVSWGGLLAVLLRSMHLKAAATLSFAFQPWSYTLSDLTCRERGSEATVLPGPFCCGSSWSFKSIHVPRKLFKGISKCALLDSCQMPNSPWFHCDSTCGNMYLPIYIFRCLNLSSVLTPCPPELKNNFA